jgi:L-threonylcarbamoyladenylate synthase
VPSRTRVVRVDPSLPDPTIIQEAASLLRAGQLVAFPTETVYGLGANALDEQAVQRIFEAKERPTSDPLIVHIVDGAQFDAVATDVPDVARRLTARFWPGPLTLVLRRSVNIPPNVSSGLDTVAVRMPEHPVAQAILRAADVPIAAPSANLFSRPSPTTAHHVLNDLDGRIAMIIDGGPTTIGLESTIVSLVEEAPMVLRPGGVTLEALRAALPTVIFHPRYLVSEHAHAPAPGMLLKHYSPSAETLLFSGRLDTVLMQMRLTARTLVEQGKKVGILTPEEEQKEFADLPVQVALLGSRRDLGDISARLFGGLRELDQQHVDVILVRGFERIGLGVAIWDRLLRATEGRVIDVDAQSPAPG